MYWTVVASKPFRDEIFITTPACTGANTTLVQREPVPFALVKRPLYGLYHPPSSSEEIKNIIEQ